MRDIKITRPTQISVDANFPVSGKAKNISSAGDNTGTPWIEDIINDRSFGWQERILSIAGIVPNGLEENASQSQISEAIEILIKIVSSGYDAVGSFRWGLVYTSDNDVGIYQGKAYKYVGGDSYPVTVPANTVDPSVASDYEEVVYNPASNVNLDDGDNIQQRLDNTSLEFNQVSDVDGSPRLKVGMNVICYDYKLGNNAGLLFFKVVTAGTGTHDGGKYIDLPISGWQLEQNLKKPYNAKAWGAPLNGVDDDSTFIQNADNYVASLGGGLLTFPSGTLSIGSKINKSMFTHWQGEMTPNKFLASDTEYFRGTSIRPLYNGVLIETDAQTDDQVGFCGLENFACAGRIEETDDNINSNFDNVVVFRQIGERMKGLKFKNLIFKRVAKGIELNNASFCTFDHLDFRCKENIDAPTLSDSEFIRCELGSGLPAGATLKSFLSGGYGLRMIGDSSAGSAFNGNNRFHRCRFQLAASTFTNSRFEWMRNLKFFDCIFDQNEAQGGVFLDCDEVEFHGVTGFNNAEGVTPKWTLQFGLGGANGCTGVKFFGGALYNKANPNANAFDGNGLLFSDTSDYEMHGIDLDDSLVNKISGASLSNRFYGGNCGDYLSVDLTLQNSWVENSTASTPKVRKEGNICHVSGAIKDGTRTNGTVIFTLPAGYRPSRTKYVPIFSGPAGDPEYLTITTNGNASISGGDWVAAALNGIDFSFDLVN